MEIANGKNQIEQSILNLENAINNFYLNVNEIKNLQHYKLLDKKLNEYKFHSENTNLIQDLLDVDNKEYFIESIDNIIKTLVISNTAQTYSMANDMNVLFVLKDALNKHLPKNNNN